MSLIVPGRFILPISPCVTDALPLEYNALRHDLGEMGEGVRLFVLPQIGDFITLEGAK